MAQRRFHYEQAFEHYLRSNRVPYIAVDEAKRALLPPDPALAALKSFDFVVYGSRGNLLIDVKGRAYGVASEVGADAATVARPVRAPGVGRARDGPSPGPAPGPAHGAGGGAGGGPGGRGGSGTGAGGRGPDGAIRGAGGAWAADDGREGANGRDVGRAPPAGGRGPMSGGHGLGGGSAGGAGRRSGGRSRRRFESWVTRDDVASLRHWESLFGTGFEAMFVFMYCLEQQPPDVLFEEVFTFGSRWYALRCVPVVVYERHMVQRSAQWETVFLPAATFARLSRPFTVRPEHE